MMSLKDKVAIVGMGGLGHVGVQIAAAMGAEVTVISQTMSKREDGLKFGAQHYYAMNDPESLRPLRGTLDLIVSTVAAVTSTSAMPVQPESGVSSCRYSSAGRPTAEALTRIGRSLLTSTTSRPSAR